MTGIGFSAANLPNIEVRGAEWGDMANVKVSIYITVCYYHLYIVYVKSRPARVSHLLSHAQVQLSQ